METNLQMSFKVVLIGDISVGKTSIIYRFTNDEFDQTLVPTLGMTFSKKLIERKNMKITLEIWDTAGQEKYKIVAPIYYRNAQAVLIVFDVTRNESLQDAKAWLDEVNKYLHQDCIKYLVANKIDQKENFAPNQELVTLLQEHNMSYIETSAKSGYNIHRLFRRVARSLAKNKLKKLDAMEQIQIIKLQPRPVEDDKEQSKSQIQGCCSN